MRKSGCVGTCAFFILERKVIFLETGNQFLGTEHIGKLMRQYAIPCIISLLVGTVALQLVERSPPGSFLSSAICNWMVGHPVENQYKVITDLAAKGPCVIIGGGSDCMA